MKRGCGGVSTVVLVHQHEGVLLVALHLDHSVDGVVEDGISEHVDLS